MTVSTTSYSPMTFAGNGSTTVFAVSWPFFTGSLVVSLIDEDDVETIKTISTHYTITGGTAANGTPSTGTVTMLTAPATGETLKIARNTPQNQPTTFVNNDAFPAKTVEATVDRAILVAQESVYKAELAETFASDAEASASEAATQAAAAAVSAASAALVTASIYDDVLNAKSMGATGDGTTNDTTSLQNAINAAYSLGVPLYIPSGTYMVSGLTWKSGVEIYGASRDATTIKLIANSNTSVITSDGAGALFGTGSTSGIVGGEIHDLTIDGNWSPSSGGQSAGHGIAVYGRAYRLYNLSIINCRQQIIKSEWGNGGGPMEASISMIVGDVCGEHGFTLEGPHDSYVEDVILIDPGQTADDTYDGLVVSGVSNGRFINVHPWHRGTTTNRMRYAGNISTDGSQIFGCHFEGARQNLRLIGSRNHVAASPIYANYSNDPMWILAGNHNRVDTYVENSTSYGYNAVCLQIGEVATSLYNSILTLNLITSPSATAAVSVVNDGGKNSGFIQIEGVATDFTGAALAQNTHFLVRSASAIIPYFTGTHSIMSTIDNATFAAHGIANKRPTGAAFDSAYSFAMLTNASGNLFEGTRIYAQSTAVTAGAETVRFVFSTRSSGTIANRALLDETGFYPATTGALTLGGSGAYWTTTFTQNLRISSLGNYADDTAAAAGGIAVNQVYRNGSVLMIRVT